MSYNDKEWKSYNADIENFIKEYLNEDFAKNYLKDRLNNFTITFKTFQKPNNNAPKSIKGDYDLSIHGNTIVLVDNTDGTTVEAKCHPDDNFDIGAGIKEAFKKLNEKREEIRKQKEEEEKKINVGDWVEVLEDIVFDPYCGTFFEDNNLMQYAPRFCYGLMPDSSVVGKVLFANKHHLLIEEQDKYGYNKIYLVDNIDRYLKKVAKPNV